MTYAMGEMADDYDGYDDSRDFESSFWVDASNEELVSETARSRSPKIMSIRKYFKEHGFLSGKQRWCLVYWITEGAP